MELLAPDIADLKSNCTLLPTNISYIRLFKACFINREMVMEVDKMKAGVTVLYACVSGTVGIKGTTFI